MLISLYLMRFVLVCDYGKMHSRHLFSQEGFNVVLGLMKSWDHHFACLPITPEKLLLMQHSITNAERRRLLWNGETNQSLPSTALLGRFSISLCAVQLVLQSSLIGRLMCFGFSCSQIYSSVPTVRDFHSARQFICSCFAWKQLAEWLAYLRS